MALQAQNERSVTYSELRSDIESLSNFFLNEMKWTPGDLICILTSRSVIQAEIILALLACEMIPLTLDGFTTQKELNDLVMRFPIKGMMTNRPDLYAGPVIHQDKFGGITSLTIGKSSKINGGLTLLTSGSTGTPKGVLISSEDLKARALSEIKEFEISEKNIILNLLPFSHDLGLNQLLSSFFSGSLLKITNALFASHLEDQLKSGDDLLITGTPFMWRSLMKNFKDKVFTSVRLFTISGGRLEPEEQDFLLRIFPEAKRMRTYGQTETFRSLCENRVISGVRLNLLPDGELCHQGIGVMREYLGDASATSIKKMGDVIFTGDLFELNSNGEYHFLGRKDRMIKRFDHRVYPEKIENFLTTQDGVSVAKVRLSQARMNRWEEPELIAEVQSQGSITLDLALLEKKTAEVLGPILKPDRFFQVENFTFSENFKVKHATSQTN